MAFDRLADRPIQPRRDNSDEEYFSDREENIHRLDGTGSDDNSQSEDHEVESDIESTSGPDDSTTKQSNSESSDEESEDLKNISFGALAKAQATFAPPSKSQKRKLSSIQTLPDENPLRTIDNPHPTPDTLSKKPKQDLTGRTSKHAPAVLSSRNPVTRNRTIFSPPPTQKSRDPRFDATITSTTLNPAAVARADKAYSFLTDYQATEILQLKSEIKKSQTRNPAQAADLKKKLMSMQSRLRNNEIKTKEREILRQHNLQEKQAIKEGKKSKPYFLKQSDVRKEIEKERVDGMGKRQKDKMEKRKRMREKTKEARDMPWARRMG